MGTYPWGPHGPQSGPNQVTPNPTPAYVPPPPSAPSYGSPAPVYGGGGGGGGGAPIYTGPYIPRKKSYILAVILTLLFGPLGLFYATKKGALIMLLLLVGAPVALSMTSAAALHHGPFAVLDNDAVMEQMWSICAFVSVLWSVVAVASYNRALKKRG